MKRTLGVVVALVLAFSVGLLAKDFSVTACTTDKIEATLKLDIKDTAPDDAKSGIEDAFRVVASALTFQELIGDQGFYNFVEGLTPAELEFINIVDGPPIKTGTCK